MPTTPLLRARLAVSVLFIINACALSAWLPRLAELQAELGLNDAQLGLVLAAGAAGGLLVGPLGGYLIAHSSSARVATWAFILIVPALPVIGLAPNGWVLGAALAWLGALDAVMDGAMNAHGLRVQRRYGRSIINSFHGYWSVGTVGGALVGTACLAIGIPIAAMMAGIAAASLVALAATRRWLLPGADPASADEDADAASEATTAVDPSSMAPAGYGRVLTRATALLGLFTLLAVVVEDVPARWSSIYLTDVGAPAALAGIGFTAFTIAMTVGRFTGDRLVDRFGEARVVRASMAAAGLSLGAALMIGTSWAFVGSCVAIGLGVATLFPAAMHAATQIPGVRPAMGIATVGWLARGGFVIAPVAVGLVAERFGIAWGLTVPIAAAALLIPLSRILTPQKFEPIP